MEVTDYTGTAVHVDYVPVPNNSSIVSAVFAASVPAAGFSTYFLEFTGSSRAPPAEVTDLHPAFIA